MRGCLEGGCPRGLHHAVYERTGLIHYPGDILLGSLACACGNTWPCPEAAEPGSSYDTGPGFCASTHAEINAILTTGWAERQNATLYVNTEPCMGCLKIVACSGISRVVWPGNELTFPFLSCYDPAS